MTIGAVILLKNWRACRPECHLALGAIIMPWHTCGAFCVKAVPEELMKSISGNTGHSVQHIQSGKSSPEDSQASPGRY